MCTDSLSQEIQQKQRAKSHAMSSEGLAEKLLEALKNNECSQVEELIANGIDVNQVDAKGTKPLQHSAKTGCTRCLTLLLNHGAQIEAVDTNGTTALTYAAHHEKRAGVQFLHDRGANAFTTDRTGWLSLHDACHNEHVEVARFLLEKYPDTVNCTTTEEHGRWMPLHMTAASGSVDCIELLLQHGANMEAVECGGKAFLYIAAANSQLPAVKYLLKKGACGRATSEKGWLPLHDVCFNKHVDVARFLLQQCPDIVNCTTTEESGY